MAPQRIGVELQGIAHIFLSNKNNKKVVRFKFLGVEVFMAQVHHG